MASGDNMVPMEKMATVMTQLLSKEPAFKEGSNQSRKRHLPHDESSSDEDESILSSSMDAVSLCHFPPEPSMWEYERRLKRLATRGVVQLFNVVDKQQKDLQAQLEEVGSSERKRSKVLSSIDKGRFLDMLKEHKTVTVKQPKRSQVYEEPSWSLLKDNEGLETAMKHWEQDDNNIHDFVI